MDNTSTPDEFENAVDGVNDESVTIVREQKRYPICPKGLHKGTCIKAEIKEGKFGNQISLTWELDTTFEDENENGEKVQKHFRVFDTLSPFFGPKARCNQAFKELTGEDIGPLVQEKKFKKDGKNYVSSTFRYQAFLEMKADLLIKHVEGKSDPSAVYANIAGYNCDEATQAANAALVFSH